MLDATALGIGAAVGAAGVGVCDTAGLRGSAGSSDSSASGGASSGGSRGHAGPRSRSGAVRSDEGSSAESTDGAGLGSGSTVGPTGVSVGCHVRGAWGFGFESGCRRGGSVVGGIGPGVIGGG